VEFDSKKFKPRSSVPTEGKGQTAEGSAKVGNLLGEKGPGLRGNSKIRYRCIENKWKRRDEVPPRIHQNRLNTD